MSEPLPTTLQLALAIERSDESPIGVAEELHTAGRSAGVAVYEQLSPEARTLIDAEADKLHRAGIGATLACEADFPARLARRKPLLFHRGDPAALNDHTVGVLASLSASTIAVREARICGEIIAEAGYVTVTEHRPKTARNATFGALEAGGTCVLVLDEGITRYRPKRRLTVSARTSRASLSAISLLEPTEKRSADTTDDAKDTITDLSRCVLVLGMEPGDMIMMSALRAIDHGRPVLILSVTGSPPSGYDVLLRAGAIPIQQLRHLRDFLQRLRTV